MIQMERSLLVCYAIARLFSANFYIFSKKQALQVKKQKQLNFVTPIIAFSIKLPIDLARVDIS
jgi:hypothetical protein